VDRDEFVSDGVIADVVEDALAQAGDTIWLDAFTRTAAQAESLGREVDAARRPTPKRARDTGLHVRRTLAAGLRPAIQRLSIFPSSPAAMEAVKDRL
jgi:hypothetical protein